MTRRPGPEERDDLPPLFAYAQREAAVNRAEVGMTRAADRASRIHYGWRAEALEAVRRHAERHTHFLCEDVTYALPENADGRAWGAIMRDAVRAGFVVADGAAPANSSNRSFKTRWRSLIHVAGTSPAASH